MIGGGAGDDTIGIEVVLIPEPEENAIIGELPAVHQAAILEYSRILDEMKEIQEEKNRAN